MSYCGRESSLLTNRVKIQYFYDQFKMKILWQYLLNVFRYQPDYDPEVSKHVAE